jgi:broad specificity phosphatase PhoE
MTDIILVRHGETEYNASETFRGRVDVPLNDTGHKQAGLLGEYLAAEKIDAIYSSPLMRAVETAEAIAVPQKLKVNVNENLNDIDCGAWQGLTLREVRERYGAVYRDWAEKPGQVKIPGGESLEDVRKRAMPFVQDAAWRCGEGKIVLVSHRAVNKVLICALLGLDNSFFWSFKLDTASITRFSFDGNKAVLTSHNDTSFLKPLELPERKDF